MPIKSTKNPVIVKAGPSPNHRYNPAPNPINPNKIRKSDRSMLLMSFFIKLSQHFNCPEKKWIFESMYQNLLMYDILQKIECQSKKYNK